jgi:hypothetical protein
MSIGNFFWSLTHSNSSIFFLNTTVFAGQFVLGDVHNHPPDAIQVSMLILCRSRLISVSVKSGAHAGAEYHG